MDLTKGIGQAFAVALNMIEKYGWKGETKESFLLKNKKFDCGSLPEIIQWAKIKGYFIEEIEDRYIITW